MSLALAFLRQYFTQHDVNQADYANACGIDPALVSKLLRGDVAVSGKNLPKLLLGFPEEADKLSFLAGFLRDHIPNDHAHQISVSVTNSTPPAPGVLMEPPEELDPTTIYDAGIAHVVRLLPLQTRLQLYLFIKALRRDSDLRILFKGIMRYLPEDIKSGGHQGAPKE